MGKNQKNGKRGQYARSTPLARVGKNFSKAYDSTKVALQRLTTWEAAGDTKMAPAIAHGVTALEEVTKASEHVIKLEATGWKPPKKSLSIVFAEGDTVRIADKYLDKYLAPKGLYPKKVVSKLVVVKMMETGEVAVRHEDESPFMVAKSHILKRKEGRQPTANGKKLKNHRPRPSA